MTRSRYQHLRSNPRRICYLALFGEMEGGERMLPCNGRLVVVHLIPRRVIREAGGYPMDRRSWVWGCGGTVGVSGHHGMLDSSRKLRLPREAIPERTEELARELGLEWYLDRNYPRKKVNE